MFSRDGCALRQILGRGLVPPWVGSHACFTSAKEQEDSNGQSYSWSQVSFVYEHMWVLTVKNDESFPQMKPVVTVRETDDEFVFL